MASTSDFKHYGDALLAATAKEMSLPVYTFDKLFHKELKKGGIPAKLLQ